VVTTKTGIKQVIHSVAQLFAETVAQPIIPARASYKAPSNVAVLSTGFRPLDKALGVNGLPQGKISELIVPGNSLENGGATLVSAKIAAKVQRAQGVITVIDMSHNFDPWQAKRCGLVAPQLLLTRPDTIFAAVSSLEGAAKNAKLVIVVMGNVVELLRHIEPNLLKTLLRRLQNITRDSEGGFLFMTTSPKNDPFDPEIYPAGFPLSEIATVRLWLQEESWTYTDGLATAYKTGITIVKNDLAMVGKGANIRIKLVSP